MMNFGKASALLLMLSITLMQDSMLIKSVFGMRNLSLKVEHSGQSAILKILFQVIPKPMETLGIHPKNSKVFS